MISQERKPAFRVGLTADFFDTDGSLKFRDVGLTTFDKQPGVEMVRMPDYLPIVGPEQLLGLQGAILMEVGVDQASVSKSEDLLALARFGVGYNDVDVKACSDAGVLFFTAAGAVDRSMAEATVTWMLALSHSVRAKDLLVRQGSWDKAHHYIGWELRERTLGVVGLGGIARKTIELLQSFSMLPPIAYDPLVDPAIAQRLGVKMVSLDDLLKTADFVSIHCPLNDQTRNLLGKRELSLMKPEAVLINTARGGIVNEDALFEALEKRKIAGAALDVFVGEPFTEPHRFAQLDNVLLAPHAIGLTHEIYRDIGRRVCQGMIDLACGKRPASVINPEVLGHRGFEQKWARLALSSAG